MDAKDKAGETPLHEAAEYGHLDVVKVPHSAPRGFLPEISQ